MRLDLKIINHELTKRGHDAHLEKGAGYFYFHSGEAADWLDAAVRVRKINDLTLKQWMEEFARLKALNAQIMASVKPGKRAAKPPA
jgi:hypothetical protein